MKKKIVIIIILILIIVAGCGVYYFTQMKDTKKDSSTAKPTTTETEKPVVKEVKGLDITDDIVTTAMSKIEHTADMICGEDQYDLFISKEKFMASDIKDEIAVIMLTRYYSDKFKNDKGEIKASEIDNMIQSILGKDYKLKRGIIEGCVTLKYNKAKDSYQFYKPGCGGMCDPTVIGGDMGKITKADLIDDKLEVTYKVLFTEDIKSSEIKDDYYIKYYNDYAKKHQVNINKDLYYDGRVDIDEDNVVWYKYIDIDTYKPFKDAATYKFTFEKQDDTYVFVSSELVK